MIAPASEPRRRGYWVPRAAVFTGAAVLTAAFAHELFGILAFGQITPLQFVFLILSTIAFGWIALGSLSAALGFLPLFAGEDAGHYRAAPAPNAAPEPHRLLFPVYHEEPARIAGTIEAIARELAAWAPTRPSMSSSFPTRAGTRTARGGSCLPRPERPPGSVLPVYYRRRRENTARKAGNISDWVARFGGDYEHFVILDGDSVMSGGDAGPPRARHGGRAEGRPDPDRAAPRRR